MKIFLNISKLMPWAILVAIVSPPQPSPRAGEVGRGRVVAFLLRRSILAAILFQLGSVAMAAAQSSPWIDYGLYPDGTKFSWNAVSSSVDGPETYKVWTRIAFTTPQPVPGKNSFRPAKTAFTQYRINCASREVQPIAATFRDSEDQVITTKETPGPKAIAVPSGDKIRDRLFLSVCTKLNDYGAPSPTK